MAPNLSKVEEVARALCKARGFNPDDDAGGHSSPTFVFFLDEAHAVIAAYEKAIAEGLADEPN